MKNNYLIGFLVLTVVVLGYFVLKGGNATTEEQNQTSAAATAKLQTYSNATTAQPIQKATTVDLPLINYTFTKTLASGMKSDEVTKLQQVLAENVYYEGEMTGVMDKLTVQELKDFQTDNGLEVTGTTGPKTRALLSELSRHHGPCAGGQPAIRVRKPNGGEVYQAGQIITVRWRTCHISNSAQLIIAIQHHVPAGNGYGGGNYASNLVGNYPSGSTINDKSETVILPTQYSGHPFGQNFKIMITTHPFGGTVYDVSNNLFTINSSVVHTPSLVVSAEYPTTGALVTSALFSGMQIARFKVTNTGTVPATLNNIRLIDGGSHSGTSATYWLYASDENMNNNTATNIGGRLNSFDFTPLASYPIVHPGSYRYITVVINNTSGIQSGDTFSLGALANGDVNYYVSEQDLGYDTNGDGDMNDRVYNLPTIGNPQLGTVQIN
jgi:peptidoglycan hydrolase-like protein with peptidoglycan-binding domain